MLFCDIIYNFKFLNVVGDFLNKEHVFFQTPNDKSREKNNDIVLQKIWNQHCIKLNKFWTHKRNEGEKPGQKICLTVCNEKYKDVTVST